MIGKVNRDYYHAFGNRDGTGAARTGDAANLACTVTHLSSSNTNSPTVVEDANGQYHVVIPAAFTNTNGAGEYAVLVRRTATPNDLIVDNVVFFVNDFDDLDSLIKATGQIRTWNG